MKIFYDIVLEELFFF